MKEIWSLMGLFHAYGGKRHSWNFFFFGSQEKVKPNEALPDWSFLFSLWIRMDLGVFCLFVWGDFLFVGFRIKLEVLWILGIFWLWSSPLKVELYIYLLADAKCIRISQSYLIGPPGWTAAGSFCCGLTWCHFSFEKGHMASASNPPSSSTCAQLDPGSLMVRLRGNDPFSACVGVAEKADDRGVVCNCTQCDYMLRFGLFLMWKLYILLGVLESGELIEWF